MNIIDKFYNFTDSNDRYGLQFFEKTLSVQILEKLNGVIIENRQGAQNGNGNENQIGEYDTNNYESFPNQFNDFTSQPPSVPNAYEDSSLQHNLSNISFNIFSLNKN